MGKRPNHTGPASLEQSQGPGTWDLLRKLTGMDQPEALLRGFSLHLGDGCRWWIGSTPPGRAWVEKLAALMQLEPGEPDGACRLILFDGVADSSGLPQEAPGWVHLNLYRCQAWHRPGFPDVLWEFAPAAPHPFPAHPFMVYASTFIHRESIWRGGLPFHATLVERDGQGVILAAPSGTGKSTCCRRIPPPWQARCDDELLVVLAPDGRYLAHPFPTWSDYFFQRGDNPRKVQDPAPLAGIFFLEQAPWDDYTPLGPGEAAAAAAGSALEVLDRLLLVGDPGEARDLRQAVFANACDLVTKIPAFRLQVSLTGRFWENLEAALGWR